MYRIDDRPAAIKEVQLYLRGVGYDTLPVIISGIFDDNTVAAVKNFQEKMDISPSGTVDFQTFTLLYEEYVKRNYIREIVEGVNSRITFPLSVGMQGGEVERINDLTIEILDYYGHHHTVRRSGYFSSSTEEGVMIIQELFNIAATGEVDEITYGRMLTERDSIFNFKTE